MRGIERLNTQSYAIIRVGAVGRVIGVDFCIHAGTRGGVATLLHKGMVHRPDRPEGATRNTHDRQRVADDGTSLVGNDVLVCGPPAQASLYSSP